MVNLRDVPYREGWALPAEEKTCEVKCAATTRVMLPTMGVPLSPSRVQARRRATTALLTPSRVEPRLPPRVEHCGDVYMLMCADVLCELMSRTLGSRLDVALEESNLLDEET